MTQYSRSWSLIVIFPRIGRIAGSPCNMMYSQNPAERPEKAANLEIGIEHLRSEAQSLPLRRDSLSARSQSYDSLHRVDVTALAERRPDMDFCRPDPRSTTAQETDNGPQPSVLPIDEAQSARIPATNLASASFQPDVDMEIVNASRGCSTNFPREESEATTSDGYTGETCEASSGRCVTLKAENAVSTPSAAPNTRTARSQRVSLSLSPSPVQPRQMTFSHVEIPNVQHTKPRDKSVEASTKRATNFTSHHALMDRGS